MNLPKKIYLVGMMGTGKTTLGTQLADKLHYQFMDLDQLIEEQEGMTIAQIFTQKGEAYFRKLETEVLSRSTALDHTIISTGGGIVLNQQNRLLLKQESCIYLKASSQELVRRLKNDQKRPLLQGESLENRITTLIKEREAYYLETASIEMDTTNKSVEQVINELLQKLRGKL